MAAAKQRAWALRDRLGIRDRAILVALAGRRFPAPHPGPGAGRGLGGGDPVGARPFADLVRSGRRALPHGRSRPDRRGGGARAERLRPRARPRLRLGARVAAPDRAGGASRATRRWCAGSCRGPSARDSPERRARVPAVARRGRARRLGGAPPHRGRVGFPEHLRAASGSWAGASSTGSAWPTRPVRSAVLQRRTGTSAESQYVFSTGVALAGNRGPVPGDAPGGRALPGERRPDHAPSSTRVERRRARRSTRWRLRWLPAGTPRWRSRTELLFWRLWRGRPRDRGSGPGRYLAVMDRRPGELGTAAIACLATARGSDFRMPRRGCGGRIRWRTCCRAPTGIGWSLLVLARCHEAVGDRRGALATLARRPLDPVYGPRYLAGYLYDEGRLALLEGDRAAGAPRLAASAGAAGRPRPGAAPAGGGGAPGRGQPRAELAGAPGGASGPASCT